MVTIIGMYLLSLGLFLSTLCVRVPAQPENGTTTDVINPDRVYPNVTRHTIQLSWEEPHNPIGVLSVLAYNIIVKKVDSSKNDLSYFKCMTRKHFQEAKNNYTCPEKLNPCNYSCSISTVSLPWESNFTVEKYFVIRLQEGAVVIPVTIIMVIVVGSVCLIIITTFIGLYYKKNMGSTALKKTSTNSENMPKDGIPEEWEVPWDKLEVLAVDLVGVGSFGMVFEGVLKNVKNCSHKRCAVKTIALDASNEDRTRLLQEALIMTKLNCVHVVKLLGVISRSQPTCIIMELMPYGDLKKFLRSRRPDTEQYNVVPGNQPTVSQILRMAVEIADGMAYLESHRIVHRDLAARNCMVAEDMTVKIGDFGMAKDVFETEYYRIAGQGLLPVRWMAPESLREGVFSSQSDSWSYGIVLWEMVTLAAHPYKGLSNHQVLRCIQDGGIMPKPHGCPIYLYDCMLRCWSYDSESRPSFCTILDWLVPYLPENSNFKDVSFIHTNKGIEYRNQLGIRQAREEVSDASGAVFTARASLNVTCDTVSELDEQSYDNLHSPYNVNSESGTLLHDRGINCNCHLPRMSQARPIKSPNGSMGASYPFYLRPTLNFLYPLLPISNHQLHSSQPPVLIDNHGRSPSTSFVSVNLSLDDPPSTSAHTLTSMSVAVTAANFPSNARNPPASLDSSLCHEKAYHWYMNYYSSNAQPAPNRISGGTGTGTQDQHCS